ncbi:formate dehydrogenase accessory sulfurtransferase FdhD [Sansalvadorimonas verongulae]|uniref:formate dehydrogenase accessory sulfurtransferase FdhD n=1 Tax=Sansalvadorimonas verongulae TaxID=2172824 RepID=UPI0012BBFBF1|nr:formate dehydrogenase accessory sulfurtransferase FdhD [Sansalvadorimonas verongulae]MTI15369.1 formate dehydrogenase accessory sulfurtransferase FdhD [Sansalvadorimonas verongulae]
MMKSTELTTTEYSPLPVYRIRRNAGPDYFEDNLIEEVPVALVYNGISHAVLMSICTNLEDLAVGFSLTEGIIDSYRDIRDMDIVPGCSGYEIQIAISPRCFQRLKEKRRSMAGRTGCGICGAEELDHVVREQPCVGNDLTIDPATVEMAFRTLEDHQLLGQATGAAHAAAYITPAGELVAVREDAGRHIALDKLIGYMARHQLQGGAILVTSRASFEMVQKTVSAGIEALFAISAVTRMARNLAEESNLTLAGFCRPGKMSVYAHPQRLGADAGLQGDH